MLQTVKMRGTYTCTYNNVEGSDLWDIDLGIVYEHQCICELTV